MAAVQTSTGIRLRPQYTRGFLRLGLFRLLQSVTKTWLFENALQTGEIAVIEVEPAVKYFFV